MQWLRGRDGPGCSLRRTAFFFCAGADKPLAGSPLTYTGTYQGKPFEEKGVIKKIETGRLLQATHFSAMSGKEDKPENCALVTWRLRQENGATVVNVSQSNIATEKAVAGSQANWTSVLKGLKETAEA